MTLITEPPYDLSEIRSWLVYLTNRLNSGAVDIAQLTGQVFSLYDQQPNWLYKQELGDYYHHVYSNSTGTPQVLFIKKNNILDSDTLGLTLLGIIGSQYYDAGVAQDGARIEFYSENNGGGFQSYIVMYTKNTLNNANIQQRLHVSEDGRTSLISENNTPSLNIGVKPFGTAQNSQVGDIWIQDNHINVHSEGLSYQVPYVIGNRTNSMSITNTTTATNLYTPFVIGDVLRVGTVLRYKSFQAFSSTDGSAANRQINFQIKIGSSTYTTANFDVGGGSAVSFSLSNFEQIFYLKDITGTSYTFDIHGIHYGTFGNLVRSYTALDQVFTVPSTPISLVHKIKWNVALATNTWTHRFSSLEVL